MPTEELLYQMEAALAAGDLTVAHSVLAQLRTTLSEQSAWHWFRQQEPESYEELLEKLRLAQSWYSRRLPAGRSAKYELLHLIEAFEWCRDHGIAVSELGTRGKIGNYREADPKLRGVINDEWLTHDEKVGELRELITTIKSCGGHDDTRTRLRGRRRTEEATENAASG